jgi:hypothetical protein
MRRNWILSWTRFKEDPLYATKCDYGALLADIFLVSALGCASATGEQPTDVMS